jgi:hypothetical protein
MNAWVTFVIAEEKQLFPRQWKFSSDGYEIPYPEQMKAQSPPFLI